MIADRQQFDFIAAPKASAQREKPARNAIAKDDASVGFVASGCDGVGVDRIGAAQVDELRPADICGACAANQNPRLGSAGTDGDLIRIRQ